MKKKYIIFLLVLFMPFMVLAEEQTGTADHVTVRSAATSKSTCVASTRGCAEINGSITILSDIIETTDSNDGCPSKKWYKVKGNDKEDGKEYEGYGCSSYITINTNVEPKTEEDIKVISDTVIAYGTINNGYVYSEPDTASALRSDPTTEKIAILGDATNTNASGCKEMYKILYSNLISYACKGNFTNVTSVSVMNTASISYNYETELAKFPESYRSYLNNLHKLHPNWRFYAIDTNLNFSDVVASEQKQSYLSGSTDSGYFVTLEPNYYNWKTNTWTSQDSGSWYVASKEATEYYVDPRTYLDEKQVFVFEDSRAYSYQVDAALQKMINYAGASNLSISYDGKTYSYYDAFKASAAFSKVSAMSILARSRVETGKFTSNSVSGTRAFSYNGNTYSGYYNYYNIGAWAHSGRDAITNGLIYAYNAGWNNRYKAIIEGATFIATKYVYSGQETQYFQKFNVNPSTIYSIYGHQYQTNIQAPTIEGTYVYWGFQDSGNINQPVVFHIPVYKNMPSKAAIQPTSGNPNNWLTSISVDGKSLTNYTDASGKEIFDGDVYYSYDNNWDGVADAVYSNSVIKYTVSYDTTKINIKTSQAVSTSTVSNTGDIAIKDKTTTIDIVVTAANKTTKTYRLIVTRDDKPTTDENGNVIYADIAKVLSSVSVKYNSTYMYGLALGTSYDTIKNAIKKVDNSVTVTITKNSNNNTGNLATGDKISINNGKETKTYTYVLYGDLNGDGKISVLDLIHIRNIILDSSNLTGAYREAGDINHDGKSNVLDLILVRNDILGDSISQ
ncbi:MAG: hypothetical protein IJ565_00380 [Bacilli bacterium]|nr:hypothetical protein [Bacilli bacterium]